MKKILAIILQDFYRTLRHPNRGVLPILLYGLICYLGVVLGYSRLIPEINGTETVQWMIPNLVMFAILLLSYQHATWEIAGKEQTGYLTYLRSTQVTPVLLAISYVLDGILRSLIKSVLIVLLFWVLWGSLGSVRFWVIFYGVAFLASLFWAGLGVSLALWIRKSSVNSHFFAEIIIPVFLVSGFLYPVTLYPPMVELVTYLLPAAPAFYLGRSVFSPGEWNLWISAGLIGWSILGLVLTYVSLKDEEQR
ncbi:MAG TPA: ABC transporter permease [bacterium]|nr:ABC transporter permease [bacterium]